MRKILIITVVLCLVFSLCACGKTAAPASETPSATTAPAAEAASEKRPPAEAAPAAEAPAEKEEKAVVEKDGDVIVINVTEKGQAFIDELVAAHSADVFLEENFEATKAGLLASGPQTFPDIQTKAARVKESIDGSDYYVFNGEKYDNVIYYIHGGAWVLGVDPTHVSFGDKLIDRLNSKVVMPMYPLGIKYSYEDTYKMVLDLYDKILEEDAGKTIYLMGDSAGGNIALGLLHIIKESGRKMPNKVVLLHPAADMTMSNPDMATIEPTDPLLRIYGCSECAKMWSRGEDLTQPLFSANYADLSGYPQTMLMYGTRDILMPDDIILYNRLKDAGVDTTLVRGEGLFHVYEVYDIPEGDAAADVVAEFCKK